jgi:MOSC domain-containing protein YiiM
METMELEMNEIRATLPQVGRVKWIGLRPERRAPIQVVEEVEVDEQGLVGDFFKGPPDAPRQVTLIQDEHLAAIASILKRESVSPELLRRNIVVSGINLQSLKKSEFQIGEVILFATGNCAPCSLMEENLGPGGFNAMRGHGGITARVIRHGMIRVNDEVRRMSVRGD